MNVEKLFKQNIKNVSTENVTLYNLKMKKNLNGVYDYNGKNLEE
jgi:hypothetical protein